MLQVDLNRHSDLSKAMAPGLVMEAKMELANDLEYHLRSKRLAPLFWAGDGGIFWIECITLSHFDAVISAGEMVFHVLKNVNDRYANRFPRGHQLQVRVSGHFCSILTVPDTKFWHGDELNFFVKNERQLSEPSMFSITAQLRDTLSQEARDKFPENRCVERDIGGKRIRVYFHQSYGSTTLLGRFAHKAGQDQVQTLRRRTSTRALANH